MESPGRKEISGHEIVLDPNKTFNTDRILKRSARCTLVIEPKRSSGKPLSPHPNRSQQWH